MANTAAPTRPLDDRDGDPEVLPAVQVAETVTTTEPVDHVQRILDDHATYQAVHDCHWFDQLAYRAGQSVSASHPGVNLWLHDGLIERTNA